LYYEGYTHEYLVVSVLRSVFISTIAAIARTMAGHRAAPRGDPVLVIARMRVPVDCPLPVRNDTTARWKGFIAILENAQGCEYVACGHVAENPERLLFVIGTDFFSSFPTFVGGNPQF
jgi:hypothetical protein